MDSGLQAVGEEFGGGNAAGELYAEDLRRRANAARLLFDDEGSDTVLLARVDFSGAGTGAMLDPGTCSSGRQLDATYES